MSEELKWTDNHAIQTSDGTWYMIQREQTLGAQNGGLIYYALKRGPQDQQWEQVPDTERTRRDAVVRAIERIIKALP